MSNNSHKTQLYYLVIRLKKEDAAFLYFQLEANDGLCFYSTLTTADGDLHRDIRMFSPLGLNIELKRLIEKLQQTMEIQILEERTVFDGEIHIE